MNGIMEQRHNRYKITSKIYQNKLKGENTKLSHELLIGKQKSIRVSES